jgi:hypothetical protein
MCAGKFMRLLPDLGMRYSAITVAGGAQVIMMAMNEAPPIKRLSARKREDMNLPVLTLKPAHITLEVHYFVSELAGIRPDDKNLLGGQTQSHPLPEALEPFSEGGQVAFPAEGSSLSNLLHGFSY